MARGAAAAVERHAEVKAVAEIVHGADLRSQATAGLGTALRLVEAAQEILDRARDEADHATALDAVRASAVALKEARAHVELLGKASGELGSGTTVQVAIVQSPDWHALRSLLLDALAPHPAALADVAAALERYSAEGTSADARRG